VETKSVSKSISQGQCAFCEAEVAKSKMTQHLKFCKPRLAIIAHEQQSEQPKMRWLHILAEGRNNPQYWLHFEVPDDGNHVTLTMIEVSTLKRGIKNISLTMPFTLQL
jgi:hypothetical protein